MWEAIQECHNVEKPSETTSGHQDVYLFTFGLWQRVYYIGRTNYTYSIAHRIQGMSLIKFVNVKDNF